MKIKRTICCIAIVGIIVSGCNTNRESTENIIADKATQQKTMTKVQNDVNEILNKDYDYVLKNMGIPYCTTYYLDDTDIKESSITDLSKFKYFEDVRLVYPKYTTDNNLENSALYIEINNDKVVEVQTYEFSKFDIKEEMPDKNINLIVDMYDETPILSLEEYANKDFSTYIGSSYSELSKLVNDDLSNFEVYDKNRERMAMGFFLKNENGESNKILLVLETNDKIDNIKVVDYENSMNMIKDYIIK